MSFAEVRFPDDISYGSSGGPEYSTDIVETQSGHEQRNANWAEWIDTRLDTPGTVFVAVGAGHLAGTKSVQDYLAAKDIAVTRVK